MTLLAGQVVELTGFDAAEPGVLLIRRCTQLEVDTPCDATSAAVYTLRLLARRILALTNEIRDLKHQITAAVTSHSSTLLTRRGIGPDNAATLLGEAIRCLKRYIAREIYQIITAPPEAELSTA
ncbi:MAG: hypothetical protein M3325_15170 [Actinomycetota bacterium]|nr:hypothetical protein [Actinomycetota bacterium]